MSKPIEERYSRLLKDFEERGDQALEELHNEDPDLYALVMAGALDDTDEEERVADAKPEAKTLNVYMRRGETEEQATTRTILSPALQSAATTQLYANSPVDLDLNAMIGCLEQQKKDIDSGNFDEIEEMLLAQARTLDVVANNLFRRAKNQEYMRNLESYLRLGLKAQNQCRATLEALIRAKTPKTHVKQTNIAHGHQQVNNFPQSKLMEESNGEWLDPGTPSEAVSGDQTLETVGKEHGAEDH